MIERVAAAIDELVCEYQPLASAKAVARAAITVMREPTEAMTLASPEEGISWNESSRGYAADFYRAMIDEALKESEPAVQPNLVQFFGPPEEVATRLLRLAAEIRSGKYPNIGALEDDRGIQVVFDGAIAS